MESLIELGTAKLEEQLLPSHQHHFPNPDVLGKSFPPLAVPNARANARANKREKKLSSVPFEARKMI